MPLALSTISLHRQRNPKLFSQLGAPAPTNQQPTYLPFSHESLLSDTGPYTLPAHSSTGSRPAPPLASGKIADVPATLSRIKLFSGDLIHGAHSMVVCREERSPGPRSPAAHPGGAIYK